jgi:hypothetical protein
VLQCLDRLQHERSWLMSDTVNVEVSLPRDVFDKLKKISDTANTTMQVALIQSIKINEILTDEEVKNDGKIVVERPDGSKLRISRKSP